MNSYGAPLNSGTPIYPETVTPGTPIHGGIVPGPPVHVHHESPSLGHMIKDALFGHDRKTHSQATPIHAAPAVHVGQPIGTYPETVYVPPPVQVCPPAPHHVTPAPPVHVGQPIGTFPETVQHGQPIGVCPAPAVNVGTPIGHIPASSTVSQGVPICGTPTAPHYPHC